MYQLLITVRPIWFYLFTILSLLGINTFNEKPKNAELGSQAIISLICPDTLKYACRGTEAPAYTNVIQFKAAGGNLSANCGIDSASFALNAVLVKQNFCPRIVERTYVISDSCEGIASCKQIIFTNDNTAPLATCPPVFLSCDDEVPPLPANFSEYRLQLLSKLGNITDNCGLDTLTWQYLGTSPGSGDLCSSTISRTYRIDDSCGNGAICVERYIFSDVISPSFVPARDTVLYTNASCTADTSISNLGIPTMIEDNCGILDVTVRDLVKFKCTSYDTILRIWTVRDNCLNMTVDTQFVYVQDTSKPTINCPINLDLNCVGLVPPPDLDAVISGDNCDLNPLEIYVKDSTSDSTCVSRKKVSRIFRVTDDCGNSSECTQTISIFDSLPPVLNCPLEIKLDCSADLPIPTPQALTATDVCSGSVNVFFIKDSIDPFICPNNKTIHRIYGALDLCGNLGRCIQLIQIFDTIPPVLTCPSGLTIECNSDLPAVNIAAISATDNCGGVPTISHLKDSIADIICANNKNIFRIYQATDSCGNIGRCIQLIQVRDLTAPVLTCPGNITIECLADTPAINISDVIATDNCGGVPTISHLKDSVIDGSCINNKTIYRIYQATDSCLNVGRCIQTITVDDKTPPTIICPENTEIDCIDNPFTTLDSFLLGGGMASDNCGLDSMSFEFVSEVIVINIGNVTITRKYAISDLCGNADTCTQVLISPICFIDLAMKKTIMAPSPYFVKPGGTVPMCITVYNQGYGVADTIKLIDYLPTPLSKIVSGDWIDAGNGTACTYLSVANNKLKAGGLMPGDSVQVCFDLVLGDDFKTGIAVNFAEINLVKDLDGNILPDLDSHADNDPSNDSGGKPNTPDDDKIDGDSRILEDEDDSDPAYFLICSELTCINNVNASLGPDCTHCLKASEVLQGVLVPDEFYTITLYDAQGNAIPSGCVGREYLGRTLIYSVTLTGCSPNTCWGKVNFEDKAPPLIDCSNDTIFCVELNGIPPIPVLQDNCSGQATVLVIKEEWKDYGCDSGDIQGVFLRRIRAQDKWNNSMTCDKKYFIQKINIDLIDCPRDTILECLQDTLINGISFIDPRRSGSPTIQGIKLYPNNPACKLFLSYKDARSEVCGNGYKIHRTWIIGDHCTGIERICKQLIKVIDTLPPLVRQINRNRNLNTSPHECTAPYYLDTLPIFDCNKVTQTYVFTYISSENPTHYKVISGKLPASIQIPLGINHKIFISLEDECLNHNLDSITFNVYDKTPPTPVCHSVTQITLDPTSCWAAIAAKDLDNGSRDNCCTELHYAAAYMADIEKAKKDFIDSLNAKCGKKEYWDNKIWYDDYLEDWINTHIFKDSLTIENCGDKQVVLRVYEACNLPVYDPHVFPCSKHLWYIYNTSWRYRVSHNQRFRNVPESSKDCHARAPWLCKSELISHYNNLAKYNSNNYQSQVLSRSCDPLFTTSIESSTASCPSRLYSECMVQLKVDDKQAPICGPLDEIVVYCDGVPGPGAAYASYFCDEKGEKYNTWPGNIIRTNDLAIYGFYGGSTTLSHDGHNTVIPACTDYDQWRPIYCSAWLKLDKYDKGTKINPTSYFWTPVLYDKKRPKRALDTLEFYISDNCQLDTVTYTDNGGLDKCGVGWIERQWTAIDKCGNKTICKQRIIVKHRSDFEVIFPEDADVNCESSEGADPTVTGRPLVSDDDCEQIGVEFKDDTFKVQENACYKIIRQWTLIDWCIYDVNAHHRYPEIIVDDQLRANSTDRYCTFRNVKDDGDGYITYAQVIKIYDHEAPILTCQDTFICNYATTCPVNVLIPLNGRDNCSQLLKYDLEIDQDGNGIYEEIRKNVTALSGSFLPGIYAIKTIAYDQCENKTECIFKMHIKDCKAPTPYCLNGVATVLMPSSGSLEVWASDLDRGGSYDNCTGSDKLTFTFSKDSSTRSRIFTCKDIPNGIQSTIQVDIWVTDVAGNQDFCKTYIILQDNASDSKFPGGACEDKNTNGLLAIAGKMMTEDKEPVENVLVRFKSAVLGLPDIITTSDGLYSAPGVPFKSNYTIEPKRNDNPMNGVSTLDLILIEKHIKGELSLKSPFKMLAADVNNNKDISVLDLIELRKLILGIYDKLPDNESWKFIPNSYNFPDTQNPWNAPTEMVLNDISNDQKIDFTGIKTGDVNATAAPHNLMGTEIREAGSGLILEIVDQFIKRGDEVHIDIKSPNFKGLSGMQGTIHFEGLEFISLLPGEIKMNNENIGIRYLKHNLMTFSWSQSRAADIADDKTLFTLKYKALKDIRLSESLRIGSQRTLAESYEGNGLVKNISIRFVNKQGSEITGTHELFQNYPNPFDDRTVIGIRLEQGGPGSLNIYDATGRMLQSVDRMWTKGYHEIWLERSTLKNTGVFYYRFESSFFKATKKMVISQ